MFDGIAEHEVAERACYFTRNGLFSYLFNLFLSNDLINKC